MCIIKKQFWFLNQTNETLDISFTVCYHELKIVCFFKECWGSIYINLYKKGAAPKIIMSVDHGRVDYDEVNAMKQIAVDSATVNPYENT